MGFHTKRRRTNMDNKNELSMERRKVSASTITDGDEFLAQMDALFAKIEQRAYEVFLDRNGEPGKEMEDWLKAESELLRLVPCEVMDKGNELMVRAEVPGFNQRELEVKADVDRIFITGHKERTMQSSSESRIFSDRECKDMFRQIPLPMRVDPKQVST